MASTRSEVDKNRVETMAALQIQAEELQKAELINGRLAMIGLVIALIVEATTGKGIVNQLGLGQLLQNF